MAFDKRWVNWDKPVTVRSRWAGKITTARILAGRKRTGCFTFNDGTTQNWNLDQVYLTNSTPYTKISPYLGFALTNSQNIALAARANPFIVLNPKATECDIYLESPDLLQNQNWQGIAGYSIDVYRNFTSPCGEPGNGYYAQLQLVVVDTLKATATQPELYAERDTAKNCFVLHPIKFQTPYHFIWKPPFISDPKYKVKQVRIRFTFPNPAGPGGGECAVRGDWLIGNVCPEK